MESLITVMFKIEHIASSNIIIKFIRVFFL